MNEAAASTNPMIRGGIPGIPAEAQRKLLEELFRHPGVEEVWLYGSRAMGRHRKGSDIDLTLKGAKLTHVDHLDLMGRIDDLLLPWHVDLSLYGELPDDLRAHVKRVGLRLVRVT